jgi:hypothetical protein
MRILVNNSPLDLFQNAKDLFYITKQILNIYDLNSRYSDYSRVFSLPQSENNRELLGLLSNERLTNQYIDCSVYIDELPIIPKGKINILNEGPKSIEINILSDNFDLYNSIPEKSLRDLDMSIYDYDFDKTTIAGLCANTSGPVYAKHFGFDQQSIFSLMSAARPLFVDNIDIKTTGFFFYCKEILKEIIEQAGYVFDGSGLIDDNYNELAVYCPVHNASVVDDTDNGYICEVIKTSSFSHDGNTYGTEQQMPLESATNDPDSLFDNVNDEILIPQALNYTITFNYDITVIRPGLELQIRNNGNVIKSKSFTSTGSFSGALVYQGLCNTPSIQFWVTAFPYSPPDFGSVTILSTSTFKLEEVGPEITSVIVSQYLPDISQREFFAFMMRFFMALPKVSKLYDQVTFVTFKDLFYDNPTNIDQNIIEVKEYNNSAPYYQQSNMVYDNDEGLFIDPDYTIEFLNDTTIQKSGDILSFPFSASRFTSIQDTLVANRNDDRALIPGYIINTLSADDFSITSGSSSFSFASAETFDPGDYILFNSMALRVATKTSDFAGTFYFTYGGTTQSNVSVYILKIRENSIKNRLVRIRADKTSDIEISVNGMPDQTPTSETMFEAEFIDLYMNTIHDTYYTELFNALQNPKIINVWCKFNALELYNLDMTKPVSSKILNGTFYINKVDQWKAKSPCLLELIRINSLQ